MLIALSECADTLRHASVDDYYILICPLIKINELQNIGRQIEVRPLAYTLAHQCR